MQISRIRLSDKTWRRMSLAGICIHYMESLDGGGSNYARSFVPYLVSIR